MTRLRAWLAPRGNLLVLFVAAVIVPAIALAALGARLLKQDRGLAREQRTESLENACDRAVRSLQRDLTARLNLLARGVASGGGNGSAVVTWSPRGLEATPRGSLAYYPPRTPSAAPAVAFDELERREFRLHDLPGALDASLQLAASPDPAVRAGALLREARVLRKLKRPAGALAAYGELSRIEGIEIAGMPADLVARRAACSLLSEQARGDDLRREAAALESDLRAGRWELDRASYLRVTQQLSEWLPETKAAPEAEALAAAVEWLDQRRSGAPTDSFEAHGADLVSFHGLTITIIWASAPDRLSAFVATPQHLETHWLVVARKAAAPAGVTLIGDDGQGLSPFEPPAPAAARAPAETGLPWTVAVFEAGTFDDARARSRRRTLLAGFAALVIFVAAGSYFVWRSVSRELAVARLQSDFVSAVSHEFRTPLTTLRQMSELLAETDGPELPLQNRKAYYRAQSRATERLHRLVGALLDFGRMEAGMRPYHFERVDPRALVLAVAEDFRGNLDGRGFLLECRVEGERCVIDGDAEALARAVWNLLDNAVKYSGETRTIEVTIGRANGSVAIAVRDWGIGIPPAERDRIFEKFVRGAEARSRSIPGTGIGLTIVDHIVRAHGGTVEVRSEPGCGSTFVILLPTKEGSR